MGYERYWGECGFLPADIDMSGLSGTYPNTYYTWLGAPVWLASASNVVGYGVGGAAVTQLGSMTATTPPLGILQNNPIPGEAALIVVAGYCKAQAGGTWAVGDPLTWQLNTSGVNLLVKAASGGGKIAWATAMESAVAGDLSTVQVATWRGVQ